MNCCFKNNKEKLFCVNRHTSRSPRAMNHTVHANVILLTSFDIPLSEMVKVVFSLYIVAPSLVESCVWHNQQLQSNQFTTAMTHLVSLHRPRTCSYRRGILWWHNMVEITTQHLPVPFNCLPTNQISRSIESVCAVDCNEVGTLTR